MIQSFDQSSISAPIGARVPYVLAVVGMCGAGKSAVVRAARLHTDFFEVYFGGVVLAELDQLGLSHNQANEAAVRERLRSDGGLAVLAAKSLPGIRSSFFAGQSVLIDGLYSYSELKLLRQHLGRSLHLLAVHAPRALRAARLGTRPKRPLTIEQMDQRDQREIETLEKGPPIALADFHIVNDGNVQSLERAVSTVLDSIRFNLQADYQSNEYSRERLA